MTLDSIKEAYLKLSKVVIHTPLQRNDNLSEFHQSQVYLKREDLQVVRSYKIRGAYNKISSLSKEQLNKGIVCASAGNHAQGVALSCRLLNTTGHIFMPCNTSEQKINKVKMFGKGYTEVTLIGDTYDDSCDEALQYCKKQQKTFVHPFDDIKVIEGQASIALEILEDSKSPIDYLFLPIGGGGLAAGVSTVFNLLSPRTKIIGVEPEGAASMKAAFEKEEITTLPYIDSFVDGAAVRRVGELTFAICRRSLHRIVTVPEGEVCNTLIRMYNEEGIVVEPAGALSISALHSLEDEINGLNVACIVSGGNNDISRIDEIRERSNAYKKLSFEKIIERC